MLKQTRKIWFVILGATLLGGCFGRKATAPTAGTAAEPDKVLYEKSVDDVKHGRYIAGRLGLETLINTYPDSEYLAKAKLAIGDSYYKEGGMSGLKQSIVEYKDFITFFPFLDEAPYAQLQVGMAHYRQMEKPDRDHTEAVQAEAEFQTFLEKYPSSPLVPEATQRLRDIQEVIAQGNFDIARFYYIHGGYRAAGARLLELTDRYPLYSQADQANWMLGQIYEKTEHNDIASRYYSRIVRDYPLSPLVDDAKNRLTKFGVPVPPADPAAIARMQKDEASANRPNVFGRSIDFLRTRPDVSPASHNGAPTMTPASESGDETLSFGPQPTATVGAGSSVGSTATVETVTPGATTSPDQPAAANATSTADAAQATPDSTPQGGNGADSSSTQADSTSKAASADKNQESTSKKKKGIHKIIPF